MAILLKNTKFGDTIVTRDSKDGYQFDDGVHIAGGSNGFTVEVSGSESLRLGFTAYSGFTVGVTCGDDRLNVSSDSIKATTSTSGGITASVGDSGFNVVLGPGFNSIPAFSVVAQSGLSLMFADLSGNVRLPQGFTLGSGIDYGINGCGDVSGRNISADCVFTYGLLYNECGNSYSGHLQDVVIPSSSGGPSTTYKVLVF